MKSRGFTLIEMMIVVCIVAILIAVAVAPGKGQVSVAGDIPAPGSTATSPCN